LLLNALRLTTQVTPVSENLLSLLINTVAAISYTLVALRRNPWPALFLFSDHVAQRVAQRILPTDRQNVP